MSFRLHDADALAVDFEQVTFSVISFSALSNSKSKLINSASKDENNGTEESETSDDEYLSGFRKLQPYMYERCISKESVKERFSKKNH